MEDIGGGHLARFAGGTLSLRLLASVGIAAAVSGLAARMCHIPEREP